MSKQDDLEIFDLIKEGLEDAIEFHKGDRKKSSLKESGYEIHVSDDTKEPQSLVTHNNEKIGGLNTIKTPDGLKVSYVYVDPAHQRKGLATAMYRAVEEKAQTKLIPSDKQTDSGRKLWEQPNRPFGKDLQKGAMKRLAPYSPKDIDPADKKYLNKWTTHGNIDRDQLPHMNDMGENYKKRVLHKMSSLAPYRRNPETGEREFLLHRGKTMFDIANEVTGDYEPSLSSYTTDPSIAINFNEDAIRDGLAQGIDEYDADDFGFAKARSHFADSFHQKYPGAGKTPEEALENAYNKGFTKEGIGRQHVLDHAKDMHGHVYSAWVPESAIHNMPMMIGGSRPDGTPGPHTMARESEVIVDQGKFQPKKLNRQEAGKLALAHYDFINARTKRILNRRS